MKTLQELYLYNDKVSAFIHFIAYAISWILGIVIFHIKAEYNFAGSYLIFALSLLTEFIPQLSNIKGKIASLIHMLFCLIIAFILVFSILLLSDLLTEHLLITLYHYLFIASIIVITYILLNLILITVFPPIDKNITKHYPSKDSQYYSMVEEAFVKNLHNGHLGNVIGGNKDE
ncbi:MAG: hypothetical protein R3Y45_05265 [Bacillota bacterium]